MHRSGKYKIFDDAPFVDLEEGPPEDDPHISHGPKSKRSNPFGKTASKKKRDSPESDNPGYPTMEQAGFVKLSDVAAAYRAGPEPGISNEEFLKGRTDSSPLKLYPYESCDRKASRRLKEFSCSRLFENTWMRWIPLGVAGLVVITLCFVAWKVSHIAPNDTTSESLCSSEPCLYGGACSDNGYTFTCNCTEKYAGRHCEIDLESPVKDLISDISSCFASSRTKKGEDCQYAYDGTDRPGNKREWAAQAQGIGAWMTVVFHHPHLVTEVELLQRCNRIEQNKAMMLQFGDGSQQELSLQCYNVSDNYLKCAGIDWQSFPLEPVATTVIKFIITDVCSTFNNGIRELRIYGH